MKIMGRYIDKQMIAKINGITCPTKFGGVTIPHVYGTVATGAELGNLEVGEAGPKLVAMRFKARYTDTITGGYFYNIWGVGYGEGNPTGIISLQADDGTGKPDGTHIAEDSLTITTSSDPDHPFTFDTPGAVIQGQTYYIVFENTHASPLTNYYSCDMPSYFDDPKFPTPPSPGFTWETMAVLFGTVNEAGLSFLNTKIPCFQVNYTNGQKQGLAYLNVSTGTYTVPLYGNNWARQVFAVTGSNRRVKTIYIWTKKTGSPGNMTVRLEQSDGTEIETVTLTAASVTTSYAQYALALTTTRVLTSGSTYHVRLNATGGDNSNKYHIDGFQKGNVAYNYDATSCNGDVHGEYSTNAGSSWIDMGSGSPNHEYAVCLGNA